MKKPVVVIGMGEMGGVFSRGFLKAGYPVYPVGRGDDLSDVVKASGDPAAVMVAVGEKDLSSVLISMPSSWRSRLVLLQNELLPRDWQIHQINDPTIISVWFEKKQGHEAKVIIPSPIFGPRAGLVERALKSIHIDCRILENKDSLVFELVLKNLYILTVNIAGLEVGGTVGDLWAHHQSLARSIADDVMDIQIHLIDGVLDKGKLLEGMLEAFKGDEGHKCLGRSAPVRLQRAVAQADELGLKVKTLREILARKT